MPEYYTDDNGNRVIVRHKGPAGAGFPPGGTTGQVLVKSSNADFAAGWGTPTSAAASGAVVGANSSVNNHVVLFNGESGKVIKSSGVPFSDLATAAALANKVDKVTGRGLSEVNFTALLEAKLAGIVTLYRGTYPSLAAINAVPSWAPALGLGHYCFIQAFGELPKLVVWDSINAPAGTATPGLWRILGGVTSAADVFSTSDVWDRPTCRIFTSAEKNMLAAHEAALASIPGLSGSTKAYGALNYCDISSAGTALAASGATTNGAINTYPITVASVLGTETSGFTSNNQGRLTHTVNAEKVFQVIATLSCQHFTNVNTVFSLAKNGTTVVADSIKLIKFTGGGFYSFTVIGHVRLGFNEYVEVFFGNTVATNNTLAVISLAMSAAEV